jgi:hypothetical protein
MGVLREWRCWAHDLAFEATDDHPHCPAGCSPKFVVQEFRTPPGIRSGGTRVLDGMARQLAADYGMTDMSNRDGQSVMSATRTESGGTKIVGRPDSKAYWNPSLFSPKPGWAARGESAPIFNPSAAKVVDGGVPVSQIRDGASAALRNNTRMVKPK